MHPHPAVTILINMTTVYSNQGKYEDDLAQYQEGLRILRSIHGNDQLTAGQGGAAHTPSDPT